MYTVEFFDPRGYDKVEREGSAFGALMRVVREWRPRRLTGSRIDVRGPDGALEWTFSDGPPSEGLLMAVAAAESDRRQWAELAPLIAAVADMCAERIRQDIGGVDRCGQCRPCRLRRALVNVA